MPQKVNRLVRLLQSRGNHLLMAARQTSGRQEIRILEKKSILGFQANKFPSGLNDSDEIRLQSLCLVN
jgi:hypothetical protein